MIKLPSYNTIGALEKKAVKQILEKGEISGFVASKGSHFFGGRWVRKLEDEFQKKFNSKYAVAFNSATSGLYAMLMACNIEPGDEVITSPYTMHATASSILQCNGIPIFADIENKTFGLDPKEVEKKISKRTRGILAVNIFGHGCKLDSLRKISKKKNLFLLEDNSQAPGAVYKGKFTGSYGDAAVYSLNRHKTVQCGEGGVVTTNNKKIYQKLCLVRNHGEAVVSSYRIKDIVNTIGQNLRLTEIQAAIAYYQMKKLNKLNRDRIKRANIIHRELKNVKAFTTPYVEFKSKHVYYFYVMKFNEIYSKISKKKLVKLIQKQGFHIRSGYIRPIYLEPIFTNKICFGKKGFPFTLSKNYKNLVYKKGLCPNCEKINEQVLITNMLYEAIDIKIIKKFCKTLKQLVS